MKIRTEWLILGALLVTAFLCSAYPMYVIRPFRAQQATELSIALVVKRWGPGLAIVCSLTSLALLVLLWRRTLSLWSRVGGSVIFTFTVLFTVLSYVNVYEQMFHPAPGARFITAANAKVDAADMVLAVSVSGQPRAYPIRTMGYHHIINDRVGGVPIVATY